MKQHIIMYTIDTNESVKKHINIKHIVLGI